MRARACVVSGFHTHLALPPHGGDEIVKGDLLEHWHELIVLVQVKVCLGSLSACENVIPQSFVLEILLWLWT